MTWSDGTKSLVIGNKHFDIQFSKTENKTLMLRHEDLLVAKQKIDKKAFVTPARVQPPRKREIKAAAKETEERNSERKDMEEFLKD